MSSFIQTTLPNFKDIFELNSFFLSPYVFRGQSNSDWDLTTSLERCVIDFAVIKFGLMFGYETEERWMLYEFKKKYPLYSSVLPKQNDNFEWLAIMQHHGAPTRLLDFTGSLFVSLYFSTIESRGDSVIWCVNRFNLRDLLHSRFNLKYSPRQDLKDVINNVHIELANEIIAKSGSNDKKYTGSVIPLEPNIYTDRLSKQQGLFLMPTDSTITFFDNLALSFDSTNSEFATLDFKELIRLSKQKDSNKSLNILKIIIPKNLHNEIVRYLKEMNITAEILFPGIDGLAKSLVQTHVRS